MNCNPKEHSITYSLENKDPQQPLSITLHINKMPEDGRIRIDDRISLKSYQGFELSPHHAVWKRGHIENFYFADHYYQVKATSLKQGGYSLSIEARENDPSLHCYRVFNREGTQIAQLPAGQDVTTFTLKYEPHSIVLVRRKDEQPISIAIEQDIILKYPYPVITRGLMTLSIVPEPESEPEQQLSDQERALLKELRFFSLKQWSLNCQESKPQLELVYKSPAIKNNSFILLTPELKEGTFKLSNSKCLGTYLNDEEKSQSSIIIQYRESEDWDVNWMDQQQGNLIVECTEAENLELNESLDMRLAYGEENSKRQPLLMNEGGTLYLDGHAYRYQVKAADQEGMACSISVTSDKKGGIPPRLRFFDAQGKRITAHSSCGQPWEWTGQFTTLPHSLQVSKEVGILPLKARLKLNLPMPQNF